MAAGNIINISHTRKYITLQKMDRENICKHSQAIAKTFGLLWLGEA
jgi:hypothetical protein